MSFEGRLLEAVPDAILVVNPAGQIVFVNRRSESLFGYEPGELFGHTIEELMPDRLRAQHVAHREEFAGSPRSRFMASGLDLIALRKDGVEFPVEVFLRPLNEGGRGYVIAAIQDISERKQMLEALRASEQRFRTLVTSLDDLVFTLDATGKFSGFFGRWFDREGIEVEPMLGKSLRELFGEVSALPHEAAFERAMHGEHVVYEWSMTRSSGVRLFQSSLSPIYRAEREIAGLVGVAREITEMKKVQAQLLVSDRMASVGMLAAGIAHEINNPLAAVVINLELLRAELERLGPQPSVPGDFHEILKDASEGAARVREIVRDLKIFSRSDDETREEIELQPVLESSARMAWNELRHRALIVRDYGRVPPVEANEARLGQVFLNLIVNAAQAIPEGNAEHNQITLVTRTESSGRAMVEVRDTGFGMSPDTLAKLFTPFFTTKPTGVGTGLGLSICQRIVSGLGGEVQVESSPGNGSVFRVLLPPAGPHAKRRLRPTSASIPPVRRGRVLIMDDDAIVVTAIRRCLERDHDISAETKGDQTLRRIQAGERFDVILCDLMMPQITGAELHAELMRLAPDQAARMVFLTAGAFTPSARAFLDRVVNDRLEKPFDARTLKAVIADKIR